MEPGADHASTSGPAAEGSGYAAADSSADSATHEVSASGTETTDGTSTPTDVDPLADTSVATQADSTTNSDTDTGVGAPPPAEGRVVQSTQGALVEPEAGEDEPTIPVDETADPDRGHEHPDLRPSARVSLPPTLTLLLGLAAGIIAIAGLKEVAGIVAPTFLAVTLIIAVYPVYKTLRRILPSAVAGMLLIAILYGIIAALGASIGIAASRFATELAKPDYTSTFYGVVSDIRLLLAERGIEADEIDRAIADFDLRNLTGIATSLANAVTGLTTTMLFLLTVMIFLVMDAGGFGLRLAAIHRQKPDVADALVDFGYRVRRYWIVSTVFGLIVAVIDYMALVWLGVPLAMTFALLSFVTNYIPNIGFVLGLVPPAFIGLLSGGLKTMLWVIVIYSVVNFVIQGILQPKFTGDAVGINATTAFLSLVFWAYVFGALGALLAIPFTLLVKTMLVDRDPKTRWINPFISSSTKGADPAGR